MSEYIYYGQIVIQIIIVIILYHSYRQVAETNVENAEGVVKLQQVCYHLSVQNMMLIVRLALVDLQMGNIDYITVNSLIRESELPDEMKTTLFNLLEEVCETYNISKTE
jgi:uncharacterized membrane protein